MTDRPIPKASKSVLAQIARLPELSIQEIRALWKKLYKSDAPTHNRRFLEKRLAYKLQEIEFARTHRDLIERNQRRIDAIIKTGQKPLRDRVPLPVPGTVLTRLYRDREHIVTVTPDHQFEYEGRIYKSLSPIAQEITGTRWSGPLFFGLRKETRSKMGQKAAKGGRR